MIFSKFSIVTITIDYNVYFLYFFVSLLFTFKRNSKFEHLIYFSVM